MRIQVEDDADSLEALGPLLRGRPLITFNFLDMEVIFVCVCLCLCAGLWLCLCVHSLHFARYPVHNQSFGVKILVDIPLSAPTVRFKAL